jgi:hypothetical protein
MRRAALIAFAIGVLLLGGWVVVPLLVHKREFPAEVMVPWPGLGGPVEKLAPSSKICIAGVTAERHAGLAQLIVTPYRRSGPPLLLTLTGPGYRARARLAAGYKVPAIHKLPIAAPPRDTFVTACVRNVGQRKPGLYAYPERLGTRPTATRDGQPLNFPPVFGLWEAGRHSFGERLPLVTQRLAMYRGVLGQPWIVCAALAFLLVGLIGGIGVAIGLSMSRDEDEARADADAGTRPTAVPTRG